MTTSDDMIETSGGVLICTTPAGRVVFWSKRPDERDVFGGFRGFPVGRVRPEDEAVPLDAEANTVAPDARFYGCLARELFEETGLLVTTKGVWATHRDDSERPDAPGDGDWMELRRQVVEQELTFTELLARAELTVATRRFEPIGRWRTPTWLDFHSETEFFALDVTALDLDGFVDQLDSSEHRHADWIEAGRALERWHEADVLLSTPIRLILDRLADSSTSRGPLGPCFPPPRRRRRADTEMLEVHRGLRLLPLETPTLPPATHTNCYIIGGDELVVIDPGSSRSDEIELLVDVLDALVFDGAEVRAVLPTHHHDDHVGAIGEVMERFDAELWAHPEASSYLDGYTLDRALEDGERLRLGDTSRHDLDVLQTPGHARDHVALFHRRSGGLVAGDIVASEGTVVIDPSDGDMSDYMETLERLQSYPLAEMFPAHGAIVTRPQRKLANYLEHRCDRERQIETALETADSPQTASDLVSTVYDDAPPAVWPIATRSLLAHLVHLVEQDRAERRGNAFVSPMTR